MDFLDFSWRRDQSPILELLHYLISSKEGFIHFGNNQPETMKQINVCLQGFSTDYSVTAL